MSQQRGKNMPFQMMHAEQGNPRRKSQRLGSGYSHQQGSHQAGPMRDPTAVNILQRHSCFRQRLVNDRNHIFQ